MTAFRQNQSSFYNVSGSILTALILWIVPVWAFRDARPKLLFSVMALGAALYGCHESGNVGQKRKAGRIEREIQAEVWEEFAELEAGRRVAALQQHYGFIPPAPEQPALPPVEAEWQPVNPFEHGGAFPVEDLAQTLATATNSGTLIIAPSGCGKTRLMQHAIAAAHAHYNGMVDFQIIDCKGEEDGWLGIESSPNDFQLLDDDTARDGYNALMVMKGALKRADTKIPMVGIIDEWNNGVSSLKNSPETSKAELEAAISAGRQIVTKGRSKRLYGWMTTHTPETDSIGMDGATRQSFNIIILARGNKLGLIASVLKNTYRFVDDDTTREKLLTAYQHFMSNGDGVIKEKPVALTNLCGEWRLVRLLDYRDAPGPIDWGVLDGGDGDEQDQAPSAPKTSAPTGEARSASSGRFSAEYTEFINSAEWKAKRAERIKLDTVNGKVICQLCGRPCTEADGPEVDHFRYPPKGSPVQAFIDQPLEDLRTLHKSCHAFKTKRSRKV